MEHNQNCTVIDYQKVIEYILCFRYAPQALEVTLGDLHRSHVEAIIFMRLELIRVLNENSRHKFLVIIHYQCFHHVGWINVSSLYPIIHLMNM